MKKVIAALLGFAAIALSEGAIAQYSSPHKYTDVFGKTKIYIPNTANTTVDVITETSKKYIFTVNSCGWISLRESATRKIKSFSTFTNSITVTNFLTPTVIYQHAPLCTWSSNVWSFWEGQHNVNKPNGTLWQVTGTLNYLIKIRPALQAGAAIEGSLIYENTIKNTINSCGYGTIIVSETRPMTTFKIAGVDYTLANLPLVTKPMVCRTQNNSKIRYIPLN